MKRNRLLAVIVGVGLLLWGTSLPAQAAFELRLDNPSTVGIDIAVTDNGVGDLNPLVGVITFSGAVPGFAINVTTAIGSPILPAGSGSILELDLNSVNVNISGAGTLVLSTSQSALSYPGGPGSLVSSVGGTLTGPAGSTVSFRQCIAESVLFACAIAVDQGPFGPGAFSASNTAAIPDVPPLLVSLTELAVLSFTGPGVVSFDLDSQVVPMPMTALLVGLGLAGCAVWRARQR